jgi:hypothetical protein
MYNRTRAFLAIVLNHYDRKNDKKGTTYMAFYLSLSFQGEQQQQQQQEPMKNNNNKSLLI